MNKSECEEYINRLREEYLENHKRVQTREELIAENNIEKRDITGYHGRELLELLQNADDAYQKSIDLGKCPESPLKVSISYKNNVLSISNTGTLFDKDGIKAIVQGNNSPKSEKYIGNKGTGFRSLLNWAEAVRIRSGWFNVEFSKGFAASCLAQISNEEQIRKQLDKIPTLYIPMLAVPKNIPNCEYCNETTIEVEINSVSNKDEYSVIKQIENIDLRILLFLPNISQIDIVTDNSTICYKRSSEDDTVNLINLQKLTNDSIELEEQFYLYKSEKQDIIEEKGESKNALLAIAVPTNYANFVSTNMYSYFPLMDTVSPFNCVMHASFELGDQRNTINNTETNKKIFEKLLDFLISTAEELVKIDRSDLAYKLIIPSNFEKKEWKKSPPISKFEGLEEYYCKLLSAKKFFLTVNNEYLSIEDQPIAIKGTFPSCFQGEEFANLISSKLEEKLLEFIEYLVEKRNNHLWLGEHELAEKIDSIADQLSVEDSIKVFVWWNSQQYKEYLPKLLKTQDGNWLTLGMECYLLVGNFDGVSIPEWVSIPTLNLEYQELLFGFSEKLPSIMQLRERDNETHISRLICQNNIFRTLNFKYRDKSNIISTVNSAVDSYDKGTAFVEWLWNNYRDDENWNPPGRTGTGKFKYNFPWYSNEKGIYDSEFLYLGKAYGNDLAPKLFSENYKPLSVFEFITDENIEAFKQFIGKFGVKTYPEIRVLKVQPSSQFQSEYEQIILNMPEFRQSSKFEYIEFYLPYIENLDEILSELSRVEIVKWINEDETLFNTLSKPYAEGANIIYKGNLFHRERSYNTKIRNYMLEVFNETPWIEISEKKYAPNRILSACKSKNNKKFAPLLPVFEIESIEQFAQESNLDYDTVNDIMNLFSFAESVTDLGSLEFYQLMLDVPELSDQNTAKGLSQIIYRKMEDSSFSKVFGNSESRRKFLENGKLLVNYQGREVFYSAKKCYLPSSKIIIKNKFPIVVKGARTNNKSFKENFGCQEYDREYSVVEHSIRISDLNDDFQTYYEKFSKYARAYSERNDNIAKVVGKLKITLVSAINVRENGTEVSVEEEYTYIRGTVTNWYILVKSDNWKINELSIIIENIYSNIANTPGFDAGKIGELFRTEKKSDREFLIQKEFGSLQVIDDKSYETEIKTLFESVLRKIKPTVAFGSIDIDWSEFNSIKETKKFVDLFKQLELDIDVFAKEGFVYKIDLIPYYKALIEDFIHMEAVSYKNYLFQMAKSDSNKQSTFLKDFLLFENYMDDDIQNSVNYDWKNKITSKFGNWNNTRKNCDNCDEIYRKNYEKMNPEKKFVEELMNDNVARQMIYFGKNEEFKQWISKQEETQRANDNKPNPYEALKEIIPVKGNLQFSTVQLNGNSHVHQNHDASFTLREHEKKVRAQKTLGNKGELLVYNLLCNRVGPKNVFPRSEAYVELDILKPGQSASGNYDISYKEGEQEFFVEVKTGDSNSFYITPGELEFAKNNADKFKIIIVYNVDKAQPNYVVLDTKFWEDERYHLREIVEKIEVRF